jgi:hypothetical protein
MALTSTFYPTESASDVVRVPSTLAKPSPLTVALVDQADRLAELRGVIRRLEERLEAVMDVSPNEGSDMKSGIEPQDSNIANRISRHSGAILDCRNDIESIISRLQV